MKCSYPSPPLPIIIQAYRRKVNAREINNHWNKWYRDNIVPQERKLSQQARYPRITISENWMLWYIAWQELCPYDPNREKIQELMLSLEPQVSKNTEPEGSNTEMPQRGKNLPQQARQFVPTETRDNASHCLLRDAPPSPRIMKQTAWKFNVSKESKNQSSKHGISFPQVSWETIYNACWGMPPIPRIWAEKNVSKFTTQQGENFYVSIIS